MTDEELRILARDIVEGRVFSDRHINPESPLGTVVLVFLPLALMDEEQMASFIASPPGLIYEYMSEASPRAVNGYPTFFSLRTLTKEEADRLWPFHEEYTKLVQPFGGAPESPG